MTNDLISQAEALIEKHATSGYIHRDATLLLPGLVEEIKRLQADNDFLHKFVDDPGSTLEAALNAVREQSEVIRKQQAAFADAIKTAAATLTKWQQIAIDRTAQIGWHTSCNCGRLPNDLRWPYCDWAQEIPQSIRDGWNEWAAKEIGLQMKQEAGYLERLERLALSMCMEAGWSQEDFEAALEKIRKG